MRSGNVQSRPATVVSIKRDSTIRVIFNLLILLASTIGTSSSWEPQATYYLMVEWTNPETQAPVTSRTKKMKGPCTYKVGDTVSILIYPDKREVWLDEQPAT